MSTQIKNSVCLVTGSNRGIGLALVKELLGHGARKVYATARATDCIRELSESSEGKVVPALLDVTNEDDIRAIAELAQDVQVVINNAAVNAFVPVISAPDIAPAREEMEVNYFGLINVTRVFAPVLARNGGGTVVNISSASAFVGIPINSTYCAAKAAVHSLTQSMRAELALQGTDVIGVYPGPIDTDMAAGFDMEKESPYRVAQEIISAIETGAEDVFPDKAAKEFIKRFLADPKSVQREWSAVLPGDTHGTPRR